MCKYWDKHKQTSLPNDSLLLPVEGILGVIGDLRALETGDNALWTGLVSGLIGVSWGLFWHLITTGLFGVFKTGLLYGAVVWKVLKFNSISLLDDICVIKRLMTMKYNFFYRWILVCSRSWKVTSVLSGEAAGTDNILLVQTVPVYLLKEAVLCGIQWHFINILFEFLSGGTLIWT